MENRLGAAVQLCTLPWLGWIPDDLTGCPSAAVSRLGALLGLAPDVLTELLASYGGWEGRTRRDHRALAGGVVALGDAALEHRIQFRDDARNNAAATMLVLAAIAAIAEHREAEAGGRGRLGGARCNRPS